jgi:hypothetical protein
MVNRSDAAVDRPALFDIHMNTKKFPVAPLTLQSDMKGEDFLSPAPYTDFPLTGACLVDQIPALPRRRQ